MASPIRILHVFGGLNRNGSETAIMNIYRNINRERLQFDFIIHTEEKCMYTDEIESLGGRIFSVPRYVGTNHLQYIKCWRNFFKTHSEYKIIHGHMRSTAAIFLKIAKDYGLTTIAHSHNTSSGKGFSGLVKSLYQYPIRFIADYFIACSLPAGEWLFGKNVCSRKEFFIMHNAIDMEKFLFNKVIRDNIRKEFNLSNQIVVGHIGRFHPQKNHLFLVDIFKIIHEINPCTVLMLIGCGDLYDSVREYVKDAGLEESVIFTGVRVDVPDLLQAIDVFVLPSLYEGLGIVAIEAQTAGLPCLVADTVPEEAYLTNLIEPVNLSVPTHIWANKILNSVKKHNRKIEPKIIEEAGYNIKKESTKMELFYCNLNKY